jgi:hypothetical protein
LGDVGDAGGAVDVANEECASVCCCILHHDGWQPSSR